MNDAVVEKMMQLKQSFTGQKFQWLQPPKDDLVAKVVTCRDIEHMGGMFFAVFDDGSQCDVKHLNSKLLMLHSEMPPLKHEEVMALYGGAQKPAGNPKKKTYEEKVLGKSKKQNAAKAAPVQNMFNMFTTEEQIISLEVPVQLPDKTLLKSMYNNAQNKDEFLTQLVDHVTKEINKDVVKSALGSILEHKAASSNSGGLELVPEDDS